MPRNRFRGIDSISLCSMAGRYVNQGCRTGPTGWESIPGLLKRFTIRPLHSIETQCTLNDHSIICAKSAKSFSLPVERILKKSISHSQLVHWLLLLFLKDRLFTQFSFALSQGCIHFQIKTNVLKNPPNMRFCKGV